MKSVKILLIAVCVLEMLNGLGAILTIPMAHQIFSAEYSLLTPDELLKPQYEEDILFRYHHVLLWTGWSATWHLAIAGLLILAIRRLRISN
jgi:hypothetical protein